MYNVTVDSSTWVEYMSATAFKMSKNIVTKLSGLKDVDASSK